MIDDLTRAVFPDKEEGRARAFPLPEVARQAAAARWCTMSLSALTLDVYQLTTLIAHAADGRLSDGPLAMSFFSASFPKQRNYIVVSLWSAQHCPALSVAAFFCGGAGAVDSHPILGPALSNQNGAAGS